MPLDTSYCTQPCLVPPSLVVGGGGLVLGDHHPYPRTGCNRKLRCGLTGCYHPISVAEKQTTPQPRPRGRSAMADNTHGDKHGPFVRLPATIWTRLGHLVSPRPNMTKTEPFTHIAVPPSWLRFSGWVREIVISVRTQLRSQASSASASASGVCAAVL